MKINVDRSMCDLHGQCVFAAPELFKFDDDGELEYTAEVPPELEPKARQAASVCPTAAIEIEP
jgi:ferredoxin